MKLIITLNQNELRLEVRQKSRVIDPHTKRAQATKSPGSDGAHYGVGVDFETAKYYHDLSEVLITSLDKLSIRTNIDIKSLKSYKILGNLGTDSTSYKIAEAFMKGLQT